MPIPPSRSPIAFLRAVVAALAIVVAAGGALAYPSPAAVPYRWELAFRPGDFRLYVDPIDDAPYWYFHYTVTNRTGSDQVWAPSFVLFTDAGEILHSGRGVPTRVEETLRDLLGNALLEPQNEAIGDLRQGREHEKDGLVVWAAGTTDVNEIAMFIGGLSGETVRVRNPVSGDGVILRKTLERNCLIPGGAAQSKANSTPMPASTARL